MSGAMSTVRTKTNENKENVLNYLTCFSSRTATFVHRFLPTRYKLICKHGYLRKTVTLATRRNSRFTGGISRLAGILAGKKQKNSSDAPNSGSYNFSV